MIHSCRNISWSRFLIADRKLRIWIMEIIPLNYAMFALRYQIPGKPLPYSPLPHWAICIPVAFSALTSSREQLATVGACFVPIKGQLELSCISSYWTACVRRSYWTYLSAWSAACSSAIFRLYYLPELFYFSWQLTICFCCLRHASTAQPPHWWHHAIQYECVLGFFIFIIFSYLLILSESWELLSLPLPLPLPLALSLPLPLPSPLLLFFIFISFSNTFLSAGHLARLVFLVWVAVVVCSFMILIVFV